MLHPKGSQHDWKRRTEHAERDERWEGCVPAPSAMKSPHPNRRQRHVVLRRRNYSPHHSHPHPAVRDLNVIMVFWGMRHSHFLNNSEYVPSL